MKTKIVGIFVMMLLIATAIPAVGTINNSFQGKNSIYEPFGDGWIKTYGGDGMDFGECVQQTSDGGYIIALETSSYGAGDVDFWLVKTDSDGNMTWDRTFGGSEYELPTFVQQTSDGGYIITGMTASYGAGDFDAWLIKTDAVGIEVWNQTYGGPDYDFGYTVYEIVDGYIIGGGTKSFGAGDFDYWLIKTDSDGNMEWDKTFGGSGPETCRRMVQTTDGGYIISGFTHSTKIFGKMSCWLVKTDVDGNKLWDKTIEGTRHSGAWSIRQTTDGGYIIAGGTGGFAIGSIYLGGGDMWLVKTDDKGNKTWEKSFGRKILPDMAWDVELDDDGYILVGYTKGLGGVIRQTPAGPILCKAWIVKTDGDGNMKSETEYSSGICISVSQTSDGGHIVAGGERSLFGDGDAFLIKIE